MTPLRILHVASEIAPYAKTGGLADVVGSLGSALAAAGTEVSLVMPKYGVVDDRGLERLDAPVTVPVGDDRHRAKVWRGRHAGGATAYLIDVPELYDRDGIYGEGDGDYPDNCSRFVALCRGALELAVVLGKRFDVVHVHDWQAGLVPIYLKSLYADAPGLSEARSVLTIHNLAHQGRFWHWDMPLTGLDWTHYDARLLEHHERINLLKGGIVAADRVTTVSPRYAREILTPAFGCGLEGVLRNRDDGPLGVLNGIDVEEWNPADDPHLPVCYGPGSLQGKGRCRADELRRAGLSTNEEGPLVGVVSRLAHQKGIDLVVDAIRDLADTGVRWRILGTGDRELERRLRRAAEERPRRVSVTLRFDEAAAHRLQAASDFLLIPSRYEPCGLTQMHAFRYGTVPVARRVGGLADTVIDVDDDPQKGTGFAFDDASVAAVAAAVRRASGHYRNGPRWTRLRRRIMGLDHSWGRSAARYLDLYRESVDGPRRPLPTPS